MKRLTPRLGMDRRFAVIEALIVFAVLAMIVAVAVPAYAARAKESLLQQNAHSLAQVVRGEATLDLDTDYALEGGLAAAGSAEASLSTDLARTLLSGDAGRYVNPLSGSATVLCETALPSSSDASPPAVWITDDQVPPRHALDRVHHARWPHELSRGLLCRRRRQEVVDRYGATDRSIGRLVGPPRDRR
jgi:competence protein ComGC